MYDKSAVMDNNDDCIRTPDVNAIKSFMGSPICPKLANILMRKNRIKQRTKLWYTTRKRMITCSDIASVLGMNKYSSRRQILWKKTGRSRPFNGNTATRRGQELEPVAIAAYQKKTGNIVWPDDVGLMQHPDWAQIGGSPDGVTLGGILIEIKCPLTRQIIPGFIPKLYIPQVQVLMEIFDLDVAHFVQYRPHNTYCDEICDITVVNRDRGFFTKALPLLIDFMQEVTDFYNQQQLPIGTPMIDWSKDDAVAVARARRDTVMGIGKQYRYIGDKLIIEEVKTHGGPVTRTEHKVSNTVYPAEMMQIKDIRNPDKPFQAIVDAVVARIPVGIRPDASTTTIRSDDDDSDNESDANQQLQQRVVKKKKHKTQFGFSDITSLERIPRPPSPIPMPSNQIDLNVDGILKKMKEQRQGR